MVGRPFSPTHAATLATKQKTRAITAAAVFTIFILYISASPSDHEAPKPNAKTAFDAHRVTTTTGTPNHIYIVGCGHSGTSFFLRSIGNLPGVMCIPEESAIFMSDHNYVQNTTRPMTQEEERNVRQQIAVWDDDAKKGGFTAWVEKTPRHVNHLKRIFTVDPNALVLVLVRDGRDVAISFSKRDRTFEEALDRWVNDNNAATPFLSDPRVKVLKFEDLASFESAKEVMKQVAEFLQPALGHLVNEARLLMSLLPPATPMGTMKMMCKQYSSEDEKWEDLVQSHLLLMSGDLGEMAGDMPTNDRHRKYRTWQMMQPWFAASPTWKRELNSTQAKYVAKYTDAISLLKMYNYEV